VPRCARVVCQQGDQARDVTSSRGNFISDKPTRSRFHLEN